MEIRIADDHRELTLQRDPWMSTFFCSPRYEGEYQGNRCPNGSFEPRTQIHHMPPRTTRYRFRP